MGSDLGVQALVGQRSKAGGWSRGLTAAFGGGIWRKRLDGLEHLPGAQPHVCVLRRPAPRHVLDPVMRGPFS